MLAFSGVYTIWLRYYPPIPSSADWVFAFLPMAVMASFRYFREWQELPWASSIPQINPQSGKRLAIDIDGVVVEQVIPVLEKVNSEMGLELSKYDITDWEYPFGQTNIKIEIEKAEGDREFVLQMPPIDSALEALAILSRKYHITFATSREEVTQPWTREWLHSQGIYYDGLINTRTQGKTIPEADILIDDYIGNINTFLRNGSLDREAILFAQPWNQDTTEVSDMLQLGRVKIAHSWEAILGMLGCVPSDTS